MLFLLLACYNAVNENWGDRYPEKPFHDYDGDGLLDEEDCDDSNPEVRQEKYYYLDEDGDGFGVENDFVFVCPDEIPAGYVEGRTDYANANFDCDDSDPLVNPDADEVCDGVDNNCNGFSDEYVGQIAPLWYADFDGDGFGNYDETTYSCIQPEHYVDSYGDCDDADALIHPFSEGVDGGIELCDEEGKDENCNGIVNEDSALDALTWFQDTDQDGYGANFVFRYACSQPEGFIAEAGDCNDIDNTIHPTAQEACNGADDDCDGNIDEGFDANAPLGAPTFYGDLDEDGYGNPYFSRTQCSQPTGFVTDNTDCNDSSALISPVAVEYCNNIDDDCNGVVDDNASDAVGFYLDSDGDGHGALSSTTSEYDILSCSSFDPQTGLPINPAGYSNTNDDCDDADPNISPSADELCSENIDENCDGYTIYGGVDFITYYADTDGDGFGDPSYQLQLCSVPLGYVPYQAGDLIDCNDNDADVYPYILDSSDPNWVDEELCNGKLDRCDNAWSGLEAPQNELDDDGDGHVDCTIEANFLYNPDGTVNGWENANQVILGGDDCDDTDEFMYPDAPELCTGAFENCNDPLFGIQDAPDDEIDNDGDCYVECVGFDENTWEGGAHTCEHVDANGQMVTETSVIGGRDCFDSSNLTYPGAAPFNSLTNCLTDADGDGWADQSWNQCFSSMYTSDARYEVTGLSVNDLGGISSAGDVDGDGLDDVIIGDGMLANPQNRTGRAQLLLSSSLAVSSTSNIPTADYIFNGTHGGQRFGVSVSSAGDVDGDGLDDILVGSVYGPDSLHDPVETYLFLGSSLANLSTGLGTELSASQADYIFIGEGARDGAGISVAPAGDIDGDGLDDILIGADKAYYGGASVGKGYLILGASLGSSSEIYLSDADYTFIGEENASYTGYSISGAGDVDGDGIFDILIGAYGNGEAGYLGGKGYLVLGSSLTSSVIALSNADYSFIGENAGDYAGVSISFAGDVDGDSLDDILIGAHRNGEGGVDAGKAYLILASSLGSISEIDLSNTDYSFVGENTEDYLGYSVSSAGDIDGDGLDEILIGAHGNDEWNSNGGKTYLILGSSLGIDSEFDLALADYSILGENQNGELGFRVAPAGDIDGDSWADILVLSNSGTASIFTACD